MEDVLATIESQASTAMKILDASDTTHKKAINSGLDDELFKAVTNMILIYMDQTKKVAEQVVDRVQVLRDTTSDPNFQQELKMANEMVVGALANSENALKEMQKAVADAAQRREEEMEICSKALSAWKNLKSSHIAYEGAINSGLADQVFYSVTKLILSQSEQIKKAAEHVLVRVQAMRKTRAYHNNRPELDKMAGEVLANSEAALCQMQKAIADANEKNKARKEQVDEPEHELEMEDKQMDAVFAEINFKAWTAKMNVDYSHTACRKASASGLADKAFIAVANQIISDMDKTSITAELVRDRLNALRDEIPGPNLYKALNEVEEMAVDAMENSEGHLSLIRKVVADAEQRKKAREDEEAAEEEDARVEEVRKKARNEPGKA